MSQEKFSGVEIKNHWFCLNHTSMVPVPLAQCKEAYYRKYTAPCEIVAIVTLVVKGAT